MQDERNVAIYIRVSTDEQAEEGHSLAEQEDHLRRFAELMGWRAVKVYRDDGYSAKTVERPALTRLRNDVHQGRIAGVITTRIDRLARKTRDFAMLVEEWNQCGVFYRSIKQDFEINTATGKLTAQMLSVFAEFERDLISERVYENLVALARKGELATRPPYGYELRGGRLTVVPDEAVWVREMAALLLAGRGPRQVAEYMNGQGVPSKTGRLWTDHAVRSLLKNEALVGTMIWNRHQGSGKLRKKRAPDAWIRHEHHHEPILTRGEFDKIQSLLRRRRALPARARSGERLLSGLATCGYCEAPMHGGWQIYRTKAGMVRKKTYRCGNYVKYGTCRINRVDAQDLDAFVVQEVMRFSSPDANAARTEELLAQLKDSLERSIRQSRRRAANLMERKDRLVEALAGGWLSEDAYSKENLRLERQLERETARTRQTEALYKGERISAETAWAGGILNGLWEDLSGNESAQRAVVLQLVHKVKVYRESYRHEPEVEMVFAL